MDSYFSSTRLRNQFFFPSCIHKCKLSFKRWQFSKLHKRHSSSLYTILQQCLNLFGVFWFNLILIQFPLLSLVLLNVSCYISFFWWMNYWRLKVLKELWMLFILMILNIHWGKITVFISIVSRCRHPLQWLLLKGSFAERVSHAFSTVSLIWSVSLHSPRALAHCFNGFSNASQLTLSHRSRLGNGWWVSG